jgi:hypothetical protein
MIVLQCGSLLVSNNAHLCLRIVWYAPCSDLIIHCILLLIEHLQATNGIIHTGMTYSVRKMLRHLLGNQQDLQSPLKC